MPTERTWPRARAQGAGQRGALTVEFALAISLFLTLVFLLIELGRMMYLWNTTAEITRQAARAASVSDFSNATVMDALRQRAIFRDSAGPLALGGAIDDRYVRIDYLSLSSAGQLLPVTALPGCPQQNIVNCLNDPHGGACVRFVRARLCVPGGDAGSCTPVPYRPIVPLLDPLFSSVGIALPTSGTVAVAESLGYRPGMAACP
jgi:hypothetical protein